MEPENARGESFGDGQLEEVVRQNLSLSAPELLQQLLSELRKWRPASIRQQDDITLIVVDVLWRAPGAIWTQSDGGSDNC